MQRLLATSDLLMAVEIHVDGPTAAMGSSWQELEWLSAWSKRDPDVEMGSRAVNPLGLGHDCGPGRLHVLVAPTPAAAVAASVAATALSSCKPMFSAHLVQAGVGPGECLPVTTEAFPFGCTDLCVTVCGAPVNLPQPLFVPMTQSHHDVWTSLTFGDIVGGFVNMGVDVGLSFLFGKLGGAMGKDITSKIGQFVASSSLPIAAVVGKVIGVDLDTGVDNPGPVVQRWIDKDGVDSSAQPAVKVLGPAQESGSATTGATSGLPNSPWAE